jgi:peptidoglycan/LPS O-acetylase OafA/YrhL
MKYRQEIDGLRALAVVPVILFHAGFKTFSGGFVGVDIFFVISGFLITGILISDLEQGSYSILRFYERRARRILPALFFVILCCIPFAWLWMIPGQFKSFERSIIAVVIFASNILFWREDNYFAAIAETKPLLHTWSLAVEEQYYLLFPILLALFWKFGRRALLIGIVSISLISLALTEWGWRNAPSANFYLIPFRAWELFAGSICAFIVSGRALAGNNLLSAIGLLLILFSIFLFDGTTPFPSLYALAPVVGTALIVVYAREGTHVASLLRMKVFVGIGLVSYSAYLWHQPLFAFARIRLGTTPPEWLMLLLAFLSLGLAYFSWRFIEQPFRRGPNPLLRSRPAVFGASAAACAVLVLLALTLRNTDYYFAGRSEQQKYYFSFLDYNKTFEFVAAYREPQCFYGATQNSFSVYRSDICLKMDQGRPNVLLIGDSHGAHLWHGLSKTFPDINFLQATASGCKPLFPFNGEKRCRDLMEYIWTKFLPKNEINSVVIAGRWQDEDFGRIAGTIASLKPYVDDIVFIGPTSEYKIALPQILSDARGSPSAYAAPFVDPNRFGLSERLSRMIEPMGARYVDLISTLCPGRVCRTIASGGEPMVWDYGHFTADGSSTIVYMLRESGKLRRSMLVN